MSTFFKENIALKKMYLQVVIGNNFQSDHVLLQVNLTDVPTLLEKDQGEITNLKNVLLHPNKTWAEGLYDRVSRIFKLV